jgi:hypothetical protein
LLVFHAYINEMHGSRNKIPSKNLVRQCCMVRFNSCGKGLILYCYLYLGLPSGLFPSGFSTKTLYTPLFSLIRATYHDHHILLDFITRTILGVEYSLVYSIKRERGFINWMCSCPCVKVYRGAHLTVSYIKRCSIYVYGN